MDAFIPPQRSADDSVSPPAAPDRVLQTPTAGRLTGGLRKHWPELATPKFPRGNWAFPKGCWVSSSRSAIRPEDRLIAVRMEVQRCLNAAIFGFARVAFEIQHLDTFFGKPLARGGLGASEMKRVLLIAGAFALLGASQALAADLPQPAPIPKAPATYAPPVFSWTGFYLGINGGYGFGQSSWNNPVDGPTGNFNTNGFLVGGTLGGNYQIGAFVIGVEGDGDWNNANGSTGFCNVASCTTKSDWLATVRARAGWAWDRVLFYGTGGVAFGNVQAAATGFPFASGTQTGWTAGAGIEFAFAPNWTARVEYLFVDLGNFTCPPTSCDGGVSVVPAVPVSDTVKFNENIIRAGIDYKFGW
jgi:outer membrane immunogenic protein